MSDKFVKNVNAPIKKLSAARKSVNNRAAQVGLAATQTVYWLLKYSLLTNWALRRAEDELEYINIENKDGWHNKFKAFNRRFPSFSAHIYYYMLLAALYGGIKNANVFRDRIPDGIERVVKSPKYALDTNEQFDELYKTAMPLICLSMIPTETLNLGTYADNGGVRNTIGLGSWWYPKNDNITSSEWIPVSKHKGVQERGFSISGKRAMNMVDAWARYREDGRVYKTMRKKLMGSELSVNEFAAIFTCVYNNEKNGWMLCDFVRGHYNDPVKCASFLVDLPTYGYGGLLDRHAHEALVYLNLDNYVSEIPDIEIKGGVNSRGIPYITTSVTAFEKEDFYPMANDLRDGKLGAAREMMERIVDKKFKNARTVRKIINDEVGGERADIILAAGGDNPHSINFNDARNRVSNKITKNEIVRNARGRVQE